MDERGRVVLGGHRRRRRATSAIPASATSHALVPDALGNGSRDLLRARLTELELHQPGEPSAQIYARAADRRRTRDGLARSPVAALTVCADPGV